MRTQKLPNGQSRSDSRKRAAILDRMSRREDAELRDMLAHIAGTDARTIRQEWSR